MTPRAPLVAVAVAALFLAGCLSGVAPGSAPAGHDDQVRSLRDEPFVAGDFVVDTDGRLAPAGPEVGIQHGADGNVTVDFLADIQPNSLEIVLAQSDKAGPYTVDTSGKLVFPGGSSGADVQRDGGSCEVDGDYTLRGGEFFVDRLRGLDPPPFGNVSGGGGYGASTSFPLLPILPSGDAGGGGNPESHMSDDLKAGQWIALLHGLSQVQPEEARAAGNAWHSTLHLPGHARILILPAAPLYCNYGLWQVPGIQIDQRDVATSGHLAFQGTYGSSVAFRVATSTNPYCTPLPIANDYQGTLLFNGTRTAVTQASDVTGETLARAPFELTITSWPCQSYQVFVAAGVAGTFFLPG